jgi:hypothetical protein
MSESLNDKLQAYFQARPNVWIDGKVLATVAGGYGWRTRVSNLRRQRGMTIENLIVHSTTDDGERFKESHYRYVPAVESESVVVRVDADGQAAFL